MRLSNATVSTKRKIRPMTYLYVYGLILGTVAVGSTLPFLEMPDPSWGPARGRKQAEKQQPSAMMLAPFVLAPLFLRGIKRGKP